MKEDQANIFRVSIQQTDRQTEKKEKRRRKCKDTRQISVEKKR